MKKLAQIVVIMFGFAAILVAQSKPTAPKKPAPELVCCLVADLPVAEQKDSPPAHPYGLEDTAQVEYAPGPYYKFEVIDKLGIKEEETKRILSVERHRYLVALTAEIRAPYRPHQRCEFGPPDGIDLSYAEHLDYENEYDLVFEFRIMEEMSEKYSDIATEADLNQALARYVNREKLVQAFVRQPICTDMSYRLKNIVVRDNVPTDLLPGITPSVKAKLLALDKTCGG